MNLELFRLPKVVTAIAVLCLGACSSEGPREESPPPETETGFPEGFEERMRTAMEGAIGEAHAPGISVYVMDPELGEWSGAAGVASLEDGAEAMAVHHQGRAGSVLKTAVAVAVLQHVERKQLSLDDTLADRLDPGLAGQVPGADGITMRMLLSHRSGIPDWVTPATRQAIVDDPAHVWTIEDQLAAIEGLPPTSEPGAEFAYSNTNYNLLGEVLEEVSGRPWRTILEEDVFAVAGLGETSLPAPGDPTCPGCARGYLEMNGDQIDFTEIDPSMAGAAGGHALVTTPRDLSRLLRSVLEGEMFQDAGSLALMEEFGPATGPGIDEYGMGLIHSTYEGIEAVGHLGGTAGYQTLNLFLPQQDRYVAAFINADVQAGFFGVGLAVLGAAIEQR